MRPQKKTISRRRQLIVLAASLVVAIAVIAVVKVTSADLPTWKYTHSFRDGKIVCSIDKTSTQFKSSKDDFFLVHCYDFAEKKFLPQIRIDIAKGQDYRSEYLGCSKRYVWLKAPELTAVDMESENFDVLNLAALTEKIVQANPGIFTSVTETGISESHLTATNQDGDKYYLNLSTFKATQERGPDFYTFNPEFTILHDLPKTLQENTGFSDPNRYAFAADVTTEYVLQPVHAANPTKAGLFRTVYAPPIETAALAQPAENTEPVLLRTEQLTKETFLNAKGIGISGKDFLLVCQKTIAEDAPWYFVRFNLQSKTVQWTDLAQEGLQFGDKLETFTHGVSPDGKWLFLFIGKQAPVRIAL
jgi:hypothetical protein